MSDLISRQAAYDTLTEYYHHTTETQHKSLKEALNRVPTISTDMATLLAYESGKRDAKQKHGEWIKNVGRHGWHCSVCGKDNRFAFSWSVNSENELQDLYCPNCGAKMERREG